MGNPLAVLSLLASAFVDGPWVNIPSSGDEQFNPECFYQVELDFSYFFAAAINPDALLLTPYGSLKNAGDFQCKITADQKQTLTTYTNSGSQTENLGFETIREWCPKSTTKVDLTTNSSFSPDCVYRANEYQSFNNFLMTGSDKGMLQLIPHDYSHSNSFVEADISSLRKNETLIRNENGQKKLITTQSILSQCADIQWRDFPDEESARKVQPDSNLRIQASTFSKDCFYRVMLDADPTWQMAFGVDREGFTLFINTYVPDNITGTKKSISWISPEQYVRSRKGEEDKKGTVKRIQQFCPK
jgi:hypothetical protein